jgi:hypothetical protein
MTEDFLLGAIHDLSKIDPAMIKQVIERHEQVEKIEVDGKPSDKPLEFKRSMSFDIGLFDGSDIQLWRPDTILFTAEDGAFIGNLELKSDHLSRLIDLIVDIMNEFNIELFTGNFNPGKGTEKLSDGSYEVKEMYYLVLSKGDLYLTMLQKSLDHYGKKVSPEDIQKFLNESNRITKLSGINVANVLTDPKKGLNALAKHFKIPNY